MFRKPFLNKTKISFETLPPLAQDKKALYCCWALLGIYVPISEILKLVYSI